MTNREKILKELNQRLNGKCSSSIKTCPKNIATDIFHLGLGDLEEDYWECSDCWELFEDIVKIQDCPCDVARYKPLKLPAEVVIQRVKEEIE